MNTDDIFSIIVAYIGILIISIVLIIKLFNFIKDLIKGEASFSEILDVIKFFVPLLLFVYLVTQIIDCNLNIFCKLLIGVVFTILVCTLLHFEGQKKYYIFKIFKGYSTPNIKEWLAFLKEHTHRTDEDIIIDAIRYYKNQIEFECEIKKELDKKDDLLKELKSSDYYERELAFLKFPENLQKKILKQVIDENYPLQ